MIKTFIILSIISFLTLISFIGIQIGQEKKMYELENRIIHLEEIISNKIK